MSVDRAVLALAVALAWTFHALPNAALGNPDLLTYGTFYPPSPRGYLGCVTTSGLGKVYCFKAHEIPHGEDAGKVEVVGKAWINEDPAFIERTIVSGDSLIVTYVVPGRPEMTLKTSLSRIGDISIRLVTYAPPGWLIVSEGCLLYPINYELASETEVIFVVMDASGFVDGEAIRELTSVCDSIFDGSTSGLWRMGNGV